MARGRKMQNLCYRDIKAPNIIPKVEFTTRSFIPTRILQDNMKKFVKGWGVHFISLNKVHVGQKPSLKKLGPKIIRKSKISLEL